MSQDWFQATVAECDFTHRQKWYYEGALYYLLELNKVYAVARRDFVNFPDIQMERRKEKGLHNFITSIYLMENKKRKPQA